MSLALSVHKCNRPLFWGAILKNVLRGLICVSTCMISSQVLAGPELADKSETISFTPCELELRNTAISRKAECATLNVAASVNSDKKIEIFVARLPAKIKQPLSDPLLMLAGGPGQAASEAYLFSDRQFRKIHHERDIYLIDQRGTGRSTPFSCDVPEDEFAFVMPSEEETKNIFRSCLSNFDHDAKHFSTSAALADFEHVRRLLEIDKWNILGVSYGTRVALHYLRMHPESVRSAVLDSVLYPEHNVGVEIAFQSQTALDHVVERCENEPGCNAAFPDLSAGVAGLVEQLRKESVPLIYEDIRSGSDHEIEFGIEHLALVLRLSLYQDEVSALLPLVLHEAYAKKNFAPLARKATEIVSAMNGVMALGMHNSVVCTEDAPFYNDDDGWQATLPNTYMGESITSFLEAACSVWPIGKMDSAFKEPVVSNVPVLLLSGEHDPITPPSYADIAMEQLTNSAHFIVGGQGHNVSSTGCAPSLIAKFITELKPKELDGSCLSRVKAAPFFIDFNGPTP